MDAPTIATASPFSRMSPTDWDCSRPGISAWHLNTMPQDLICPILTELSIDDIASLAATNVLTFVSYITEPVVGTAPLSCRGVVMAMRRARVRQEDAHATTRALIHITCQDVRMRPSLLGQLAAVISGIAAHHIGWGYDAWTTATVGARDDWQRCFNTEMPAAPSYQLEVADWQARFSTNPGIQRIANDAALDRMLALPPALWPELMQAFIARGVWVPNNVLRLFVDTFEGCLFGISDRFADALATWLFDDESRADIKNTLCRLGASDRQLRYLVMPRLATIVGTAIVSHSVPPMRALTRWDIGSDDFAGLVKEAYFRCLFQHAKEHNAWPQGHPDPDLFGALSAERRQRFIAQIEGDSMAILGHSEEEIDAFIGMIESTERCVESHAQWLARYRTFKNVSPTVLQAPLIHRWVRKLVCSNREACEVDRFLQDIGAWRSAFLEKHDGHVHPRFIARAYVAEIEACIMSEGSDMRARQGRVRAHSAEVFATLPPNAWGVMLECLSAAPIGFRQSAEVLKRIRSFLLDPSATIVYPTAAFGVAIAHALALDRDAWMDLPDRAVPPLTKLDAFCARFDLPQKDRALVALAISSVTLKPGLVRRD